jgi:hypothetical protein
MAVYDTKFIQVIWGGETLEGFGNEKINISQTLGDSIIPVCGIFGESFFCKNPSRAWCISSSFLVNSNSYRKLERDNLRHVQGSLIIRDLNLGTTDVFQNCVIKSVGGKKDSDCRTVIWLAAKRNYM